MPIEIQLPRLGWSMEEGTFLAWLKNNGEFVKEGEPLFSLESDKAAQEVESIDSGFLWIPSDGPQSGQIIPVGQTLGLLLAQGETPPDAATPSAPPNRAPGSAPVEASATRLPPVLPELPPAPIASMSQSTPASPRARRAARQLGVDLSLLEPTGEGGRIRERDVLAAAASSRPVPAPSSSTLATPGGRRLSLSPLRKTIAARLQLSRQTTVPVTLTARCDASALLDFRKQLKAEGESHRLKFIPTLNDILLKLTASALRAHPTLTATWADDHLWVPDALHLGVAVDAQIPSSDPSAPPESALFVPVIRDVDTCTLSQIAEQSQALIAAARRGQLPAAAMQGACFTLSNLGTLGVEAFTPIINPPETAILGIGTLVREAVPQEDGSFLARDRFTLSLTFDHRVNDGAAAARFLQTLRHFIERPLLGLV